jgi:hypothetical protein
MLITCDALGRSAVAPEQREMHASGRQREGDRATDAPARSGDESDAILQLEIHVCPSLFRVRGCAGSIIAIIVFSPR